MKTLIFMRKTSILNREFKEVKYSSHSQIAPPQIAPSPEIAPVFRAGIVVQFGDLAQKHFQIELC